MGKSSVVASSGCLKRKTVRSPASSALLISCAGTGSFIVCYLALNLLKTPGAVIDIPDVPREAYILPAVAFVTAFLHNLVYIVFEKRSDKKEIGVLVCYVNWTAGVFETLCWLGYLPVWKTSDGRPFMIARYVMWGHATPIMLYVMSVMSDMTQSEVAWTVVADVVMVVTAPLGDLGTGPVRYGFYGVSFLMFPFILAQLWRIFSSAANATPHKGTRIALQGLRNVTVAFWSMFPVIWCFAQAGIDFRTEEILWAAADFSGKVLFSCSLLQSNVMTIEQRRMAALRVVEEGNKIKVIQELKELVQQKQQFIDIMSHELRTPLNGIIGLSENLLENDIGNLVGATVHAILNNGKRLLHVINDILDASMCYKGELVVNLEKVNLRPLVDDVVELIRPLLAPGVEVSNEIYGKGMLVAGDSSRLVQIFYNLLGNAAKFTESGRISVDAKYSGDGSMVEVCVCDTGIGIPKDKLSTIFTGFRQLESSLTRRFEGTGLGLRVVRELVDAHGGVVRVDSTEGKGSTFTIMLQAWNGKNSPSRRSPRSSLDDESIALSESPHLTSHVRQSPETVQEFAKLRETIAAELQHLDDPSSRALLTVAPATSRYSSRTCSGSCSQPVAPHSEQPQDRPSPRRLSAEHQLPSMSDLVCAGREAAGGSSRSTSPGGSPLDPAVQHAVNKFVAGMGFAHPDSTAAAGNHAGPPSLPPGVRGRRSPSPTGMTAAGGAHARSVGNEKGTGESSGGAGLPEVATVASRECGLQDVAAACAFGGPLPGPYGAASVGRGDPSPAASGRSSPCPAASTSTTSSLLTASGEASRVTSHGSSSSAGPAASNHLAGSSGFVDGRKRGGSLDGRKRGGSAAAGGANHARECGTLANGSGHRVMHLSAVGAASTSTLPALPPASGPNNFKVLSVDDDPVNRLVIQKFLQRGGYEVQQAKSGFQALELFDNGYTPDIILLDVMMPGMSGFEVCRRVRQKFSAEQLPVIMVSANNREEYLTEGLDAGSNDYICKPFSCSDLLARIEGLLGNRAAVNREDAGGGT